MNQDDANLIAGLFKEKVDLQQQIQALIKDRDGLREALQRIYNGRKTTILKDKLSDTEMARIAYQSLNPKV